MKKLILIAALLVCGSSFVFGQSEEDQKLQPPAVDAQGYFTLLSGDKVHVTNEPCTADAEEVFETEALYRALLIGFHLDKTPGGDQLNCTQKFWLVTWLCFENQENRLRVVGAITRKVEELENN